MKNFVSINDHIFNCSEVKYFQKVISDGFYGGGYLIYVNLKDGNRLNIYFPSKDSLEKEFEKLKNFLNG